MKPNRPFAKKITKTPKSVDDAMETVEKSHPPPPKTPNVQNEETLQTKKVKEPADAHNIGDNSIGIQRPNIF